MVAEAHLLSGIAASPGQRRPVVVHTVLHTRPAARATATLPSPVPPNTDELT
jgi:hypothetical protein